MGTAVRACRHWSSDPRVLVVRSRVARLWIRPEIAGQAVRAYLPSPGGHRRRRWARRSVRGSTQAESALPSGVREPARRCRSFARCSRREGRRSRLQGTSCESLSISPKSTKPTARSHLRSVHGGQLRTRNLRDLQETNTIPPPRPDAADDRGIDWLGGSPRYASCSRSFHFSY